MGMAIIAVFNYPDWSVEHPALSWCSADRHSEELTQLYGIRGGAA
jgi:hypothetical protein